MRLRLKGRGLKTCQSSALDIGLDPASREVPEEPECCDQENLGKTWFILSGAPMALFYLTSPESEVQNDDKSSNNNNTLTKRKCHINSRLRHLISGLQTQ